MEQPVQWIMKMCVQTLSGATYAKTQVLTMLLCALDKKKKKTQYLFFLF